MRKRTISTRISYDFYRNVMLPQQRELAKKFGKKKPLSAQEITQYWSRSNAFPHGLPRQNVRRRVK